jgi:predicted RNase H-like nuclease (RuvC/YqgF family)
MFCLFAQIDAPPMEGVNGWAIGFAVSCIVATASAIWSEYQRRSERKDKKAEQQTVAAISAEQDRTRLEFESVKSIIEDLKSYNNDLRDECQRLREVAQGLLTSVSERDASILKRDETIASLTGRMVELEREINQLKLEVKSLEFSRDQANHLDKRAEPSRE